MTQDAPLSNRAHPFCSRLINNHLLDRQQFRFSQEEIDGKKCKIQINSQDNKVVESREIVINDDLTKKLYFYKECCDKLAQSSFYHPERKSSINIRYDDSEKCIVFTCSSPNDDILDGFLLRLRPFILNDEPPNFNHITN